MFSKSSTELLDIIASAMEENDTVGISGRAKVDGKVKQQSIHKWGPEDDVPNMEELNEILLESDFDSFAIWVPQFNEDGKQVGTKTLTTFRRIGDSTPAAPDQTRDLAKLQTAGMQGLASAAARMVNTATQGAQKRETDQNQRIDFLFAENVRLTQENANFRVQQLEHELADAQSHKDEIWQFMLTAVAPVLLPKIPRIIDRAEEFFFGEEEPEQIEPAQDVTEEDQGTA